MGIISWRMGNQKVTSLGNDLLPILLGYEDCLNQGQQDTFQVTPMGIAGLLLMMQ